MDFNKESQTIPVLSTSLYNMYQHNKEKRIVLTAAQICVLFLEDSEKNHTLKITGIL